MFVVIVFSVIIILFCITLLCVKIIFNKNGKFPNTHIGGNPALREKGIKCAQTQHYEENCKLNLIDRMQRES